MMDAPFPVGMMPDIEWFFRETHPTLQPGRDWYPEVFATDYFFPLQRPKELAEMIRVARAINPVIVFEIGADKGGGLYHWCQCLPTVRNVIACEIRGTPYEEQFEKAFPTIEFCWVEDSSNARDSVKLVSEFLELCPPDHPAPIDVLFIDGDKLGMLKDFDAYLPLMRRPGGVVFVHDISDDHPAEAFKALVRRGYKVETIIDRTEGIEMMQRVTYDGYKPKTPHEGWLAHWGGRSCGVGVIKL